METEGPSKTPIAAAVTKNRWVITPRAPAFPRFNREPCVYIRPLRPKSAPWKDFISEPWLSNCAVRPKQRPLPRRGRVWAPEIGLIIEAPNWLADYLPIRVFIEAFAGIAGIYVIAWAD